MTKRFNFLKGSLTSAITDSDTQISVDNVALPTLGEGEFFYAVLNYDSVLNEQEIIKVYNTNPSSGLLLDVERGYFSTTARAHNANTKWANALLANEVDEIESKLLFNPVEDPPGTIVGMTLPVSLSLDDQDLFLRQYGDPNHSIYWGYTRHGVDGPVIQGYGGGGFGVGAREDDEDFLAGYWDTTGIFARDSNGNQQPIVLDNDSRLSGDKDFVMRTGATLSQPEGTGTPWKIIMPASLQSGIYVIDNFNYNTAIDGVFEGIEAPAASETIASNVVWGVLFPVNTEVISSENMLSFVLDRDDHTTPVGGFLRGPVTIPSACQFSVMTAPDTPTAFWIGSFTVDQSYFALINQAIQSLGDAAYKNVGTTSDNVAAGDDSRFSDARTPTAHNHAASDINSGTIDTARLGTGSASSSTYLRGDQTWATVPAETLPATIIDAKGDLIVGTAADTAARLAVGANGTVPTADSSAAGGITWTAPNAPPAFTGQATGKYVGGLFRTVDAAAAVTAGAGKLILAPGWIPPGTYDRLEVKSTIAAASTWRLGYYPMLSTGLPDWANVYDAGTVNMNATAGVQPIAINKTITTGLYVWFAVLVTAYAANPTVNLVGNQLGAWHIPRGFPQLGDNSLYFSMYWTGAGTGGLPTSSPGTMTPYYQAPMMRLRVA